MSELAERLKIARKKAGLTQTEVAEKIGVSQPNYAKLESGKIQRSTYLLDISKVLGVELNWLTTGQGEMTEIPFDKNVKYLKPLGNIRKVPIFNRVPAGIFGDMGYNTYDEFEEIYDNGQYSERIFYLRVHGDSMTPRFNTGDLILVDMEKQARAGDFVVAMKENGESTFKKLKIGFDEEIKQEYMQLIPLNEFYQIVDSRFQPFDIVGKIIEKKEFF